MYWRRPIQFKIKCWNLSGVHNDSFIQKYVSRVPFLCQALHSECLRLLDSLLKGRMVIFLTLITARQLVWCVVSVEVWASFRRWLEKANKEMMQNKLDKNQKKWIWILSLSLAIWCWAYQIIYPFWASVSSFAKLMRLKINPQLWNYTILSFRDFYATLSMILI